MGLLLQPCLALLTWPRFICGPRGLTSNPLPAQPFKSLPLSHNFSPMFLFTMPHCLWALVPSVVACHSTVTAQLLCSFWQWVENSLGGSLAGCVCSCRQTFFLFTSTCVCIKGNERGGVEICFCASAHAFLKLTSLFYAS